MSAVFTVYREMSHDLLVDEAMRLRAENAKLREAIANYESEQSNPVKDYTMVLRRRTELFAALAPKVSL